MPWKQLQSWFSSAGRASVEPPMPLTLVTLTGCDPSSPDEVAFYADAEFDALVEWAVSGRLVLAFAALERNEITLICTEPVDVIRESTARLPFVAAGLARADIRLVASMRLTADKGGRIH